MKTIQLLLCSSLISFGLVGCNSLATQKSEQTFNSTTQLSTSEPIIAYFSPDAGEEACSCGSTMDIGYSLTPVENGFYRKLLGRDQQGRFLVQDFYQNNHQKQTSPFWMTAPQGLNSFEGKYADGDIIGYRENGNIEFKYTYKDQQQVGKAQNYYPNQQLGIETEFLTPETTLQKMWYEDGKLAADLKMNPQENDLIFSRKIFDPQGNTIDDEQQGQNIIDAIYDKLSQ